MTLPLRAPAAHEAAIPPDIADIPPALDPRLASYARTQVKRLRQLSGRERAALVFEQYPELRALPLVDWERLSAWAAYVVLYGAASRHFARLHLAALQGILVWTGATAHYLRTTDISVRHVLERLRQDFAIETPADLTLDVWDRVAQDTELLRTKHHWIRWYISVVQRHVLPYREQLTREQLQRMEHLLLPPVPQLFHRHLTTSERADKARRRRKAQTDIVSRCATAILALTQARKAAMDRFIGWYREQLRRIETGELAVPARLVYEDLELDLPRQPGPEAARLTDLTWQRRPVRMALTIWRPLAFVSALHEGRVDAAPPHSRQREMALNNRRVWRSIQRTGKRRGRVYNDPSAFFVEVHPSAASAASAAGEASDASEGMPWFMAPTARWFQELHDPVRRTKPNHHAVQADGRLGANHAGLGTPAREMVFFFVHVSQHERRWGPVPGLWFEPEALYRGVLYGSAIVLLMLTSDARIGEVMQVSADRFVKPARLYVLKHPDGTPKRHPQTQEIVTDAIFEQLLLEKGRKGDHERQPHNVSAAMPQLLDIMRLLKAAHQGTIPTVPFDPSYLKAWPLGAERYLFQWNGRHLRPDQANTLIRLLLSGVVLVDEAGQRIDVTSHVLRHAAATVKRHEHKLPLDVLAVAMGHTLTPAGEAPEATRYYSELPASEQAVLRHESVLAMMDDARLALRVLDPEAEAQRIDRLLAAADTQTREMLERYGGLFPVTFGHCGYAGLCVRGTTRAFCIGCEYLVRRPEYLYRVDYFLESYTATADAHERMGDLAGARERRRLVAELLQLRHEMVLLAEAERQGAAPSWKALLALPPGASALPGPAGTED
jgi:hypothetical protein